MDKEKNKYIYKITSIDLFENAKKTGILTGMPIDIKDGYMHFSTNDQLLETLNIHFKNAGKLVILGIKTKDVEKNLKWEPSRGGNLFPHLYAELKISMVDFFKIINVDKNEITKLDWLK